MSLIDVYIVYVDKAINVKKIVMQLLAMLSNIGAVLLECRTVLYLKDWQFLEILDQCESHMLDQTWGL